MISVSYDVTSLAQNRYGGISEVCRQTLIQAGRHDRIEPHALYRRGDPANIGFAEDRLQKIGWWERFRGVRFDIVHALGHRLPPTRAHKLVYTLHDAWSLYPNRYQSPDFQRTVGRRMRKELLRADAIVSVSQATREKLLELNLVAPDRCHVVFNGVAPASTNTAPTENSALDRILDRQYVLFVGRLEVRKNIEHVVDAVRPHKEVNLVVVGERGYGGEAIEQDVLNRLPSDRLHHFRQLSPTDLDWLYERALVLLQPSWEEGFGLPLAEAMARGCPVISSNCSGGAEVVADAALVVDPARPEESAEAINSLLDHPEIRLDLVSRGRKRAAELSWESSFAELVEIYESLLT